MQQVLYVKNKKEEIKSVAHPELFSYRSTGINTHKKSPQMNFFSILDILQTIIYFYAIILFVSNITKIIRLKQALGYENKNM